MPLLRPSFCLLCLDPPLRRRVGRVLVLSVALPCLAGTAQALDPIVLRKTWQTHPVLEPIFLKKPTIMREEAFSSAVEDAPEVKNFSENPETFTPVETPAQLENIPTPSFDWAETPVVPYEDKAVSDTPSASVAPIPASVFVPSQAAIARMQTPAPMTPVDDGILPSHLGRLSIPEGSIQTADATLNRIIDIADRTRDLPQLLLEVRGLAPLSATDSQRQRAYQNAQLMMSGLISAGIPPYRIAAFVMLLDDAPGSVDIIRTR